MTRCKRPQLWLNAAFNDYQSFSLLDRSHLEVMLPSTPERLQGEIDHDPGSTVVVAERDMNRGHVTVAKRVVERGQVGQRWPLAVRLFFSVGFCVSVLHTLLEGHFHKRWALRCHANMLCVVCFQPRVP